MRAGARWLLLLSIFAILSWLGFTYRTQRHLRDQQAPAKPAALPADVTSEYQEWSRRYRDENGRVTREIWAKNVKEEKDSSRIELEGVRLHLFHEDGNKFDRVESPFAVFQPSEDKLYSESEVVITRSIPTVGPPTNRLVSIHTSGVTFDVKTSIISTDRPADFTFENGTGKCVGATYDPNTKELQMRSNVELNLQGRGPKSQPMKLESGQLIYRESNSYIVLSPWVRLTRGASILEGAETVVTLKDDAIERVETQKAKGAELDPKRKVEYSADRLTVNYSEQGDVEKVIGDDNARLVSSTELARTTITTDHLDLDFTNKDHDSTLKSAFARGHSLVESKPLAAAPRQPLPDTRLLRSEAIEMKMRADGREVDEVSTHAPGQIEFIPNRTGGRRRKMDGERIYVTYGPRNVIQSFRAVDVKTRTEPEKTTGAPLITSSKNMTADFDPNTGQMLRMRQWDDFRYAEGDRKAVAKQASLEQDGQVITLETAARVWDPTGSTSGDTIRLDQSSGDFSAEGHVSSSRVQDKKTPNSGLLSGGEPIQATAQRMASTKDNALIRYEGKADMWQGASRIRADRIEIDRTEKRLTATGAVQTQLLEKEKPATKAKPGAPSVFTIVKSAALVYTEADRLAHYTGGVLLTRPELVVKSIELRSYLAAAGSDNSLDRAYADGKVEIRQTSPGRLRTGTGEHGEYYVADQKIILRGGAPTLTDSVKGSTTAAELTYYSGDDRLLVNGAPEQPAKSRIRRK